MREILCDTSVFGSECVRTPEERDTLQHISPHHVCPPEDTQNLGIAREYAIGSGENPDGFLKISLFRENISFEKNPRS